jgi:hypothetical protein
MPRSTPTEALAIVPASTDKTNIISAANAMNTAIDAVRDGVCQTYTVVIGGTPTGGTYTITLVDDVNGSQTTSALAHNAAASAVQAAIRLLTGHSTATVTATGTTPNFTNTVNLRNIERPVTLTATSSLTGGTPTLVVTQTVAFIRRLSVQATDMFKDMFASALEVLGTDMN